MSPLPVLRKLLPSLLSGLLLLQLAGCGTLIFPERRGQRSGEIDPAVAILDGIGLVFFIVPGLAAFAIDFTTGAIYLPHGEKTKNKLKRMKKLLEGRLENRGDTLVLHVDPKRLTPGMVERIGHVLAGRDFSLHRADLPLRVVPGEKGLAGEWRQLSGPLLASTRCY